MWHPPGSPSSVNGMMGSLLGLAGLMRQRSAMWLVAAANRPHRPESATCPRIWQCQLPLPSKSSAEFSPRRSSIRSSNSLAADSVSSSGPCMIIGAAPCVLTRLLPTSTILSSVCLIATLGELPTFFTIRLLCRLNARSSPSSHKCRLVQCPSFFVKRRFGTIKCKLYKASPPYYIMVHGAIKKHDYKYL